MLESYQNNPQMYKKNIIEEAETWYYEHLQLSFRHELSHAYRINIESIVVKYENGSFGVNNLKEFVLGVD